MLSVHRHSALFKSALALLALATAVVAQSGEPFVFSTMVDSDGILTVFAGPSDYTINVGEISINFDGQSLEGGGMGRKRNTRGHGVGTAVAFSFF